MSSIEMRRRLVAGDSIEASATITELLKNKFGLALEARDVETFITENWAVLSRNAHVIHDYNVRKGRALKKEAKNAK